MAALAWERSGADWPQRAASRFVAVDGLSWHVQVYGSGPVALLLHGTAASSHSWRDFGPALAERCTVVAPDLPGHGFTGASKDRLPRLHGIAHALARLLAELELDDCALIVGHSVGAAIGARMILDGRVAPRLLVGLNGAFEPFPGLAGQLFPSALRLLSLDPVLPYWIALRAYEPGFIRRVIRHTGSQIDARGVALYRRLAGSPRHVAGAMALMAGSHDDLHLLMGDLSQLRCPVVLFAAENDGAVPPRQAARVCRRLPYCRLQSLPGLGHLAHEEQPQAVAEQVWAAWLRVTAQPPSGGDDERKRR
ncbi:alpha/beta hydrolase [Halorhodospira abdelmalekii]|uniref:alpha/beta fold hydrolase BchO n=1 Tax=Halorhodospira abdelmalekii TaxID=421629 RepID=UPI00190334C2|nr:alpha/beta fold hydrolase BchO [Halorhodospira abdelmalekii]MBK1735206.1 alpha/beta hydrolase [Halorhodospira abdelmalekii]